MGEGNDLKTRWKCTLIQKIVEKMAWINVIKKEMKFYRNYFRVEAFYIRFKTDALLSLSLSLSLEEKVFFQNGKTQFSDLLSNEKSIPSIFRQKLLTNKWVVLPFSLSSLPLCHFFLYFPEKCFLSIFDFLLWHRRNTYL